MPKPAIQFQIAVARAMYLFRKAADWKFSGSIGGFLLAVAALMATLSRFGWGLFFCIASGLWFGILAWRSKLVRRRKRIGNRDRLVPVLGYRILALFAIVLVYAAPVYYLASKSLQESAPQLATELPQQLLLSADCLLPKDQSACGIDCTVSNTGSTPIRDVTVGFQGCLPIETQVYADSDVRATLEESKTLPLPDAQGNIRKDELAFVVKIPLLPPHTKIPFSLKTVSDDNQKACQQVLRIQGFRKQMYEEFYAALLKSHIEKLGDLPSISSVISGQAINGSLFVPGDLSSEVGREPVTFMTPEEQHAIDSYMKIKEQYKARFPSIFVWKEYCDTPVWTVKESSGTPFHFWRIPADSTTYTAPTRKNTQIIPLPNGALRINTLPVPLEEYYCGEKERGSTLQDLLGLPRKKTRE